MFQLEWRNRGTWRQLPSVPLDPDGSTGREVLESSMLVWMEHCVECSAPECFKSCGLYADRGDGDCRRFSYGIYPNKAFSGLYKYGADIHFKRWAKLEAHWPESPEIFSINKIRWLDAVLKIYDIGHRLLLKIIPSNTLAFRRAKKYLWITKVWVLKKFTHYTQSSKVPDAFYIKLFSAEANTCNLLLELIQDVPVFRTNLKVVPGWNEYSVPYEKLNFETGKGRYIRLWVDRDQEVRLVFTWLDLVKFKSMPQTEAATPADKVKCVAWDLDNTLWKGVIGDDGSEGVEVVFEVVDLIRKLDERGIVQTIVSKNEYKTAWSKIVELGLDEYFLYPAINWDPKSVNLSQIADELNINVNTFAFIDDSEFERGEVSTALPQVRVYNEKEIYSLLDKDEFDVPVTKDTSRRRRTYIEEIQRKAVCKDWSGDLDDFLRDCSIELNIRTLKNQDQIDRCLELLHRSNQFNLSGKRYDAEEFNDLLESPEFDSYALDVNDRYGDYGIVGFVSVENRVDSVQVTDFVMSCRVAKKKIENAFFYWYLNRIGHEGKSVYATMKVTGRNQPLRQVFDELMFEMVEDRSSELLLRVDAEQIMNTEPPISVNKSEHPIRAKSTS